MEAPGEATLASPSDLRAAPPSASLLRAPVSYDSTPTLQKRKSLRTRPAEQLERQNTSPLREPPPPPPSSRARPELQSRSSKLSLFNLFSKPKVERSRGHVEPGGSNAPLPVRPPPGELRATKSEANINRLLETSAAPPAAAPSVRAPRPLTAKSLTFKSSRSITKDAAAPPLPAKESSHSRVAGPHDLPPLFQAWPQAVKHAVLEVTTITSDMMTQQARSRRSAATMDASARNSEDGSSPTDKKAGFRHGSKGSISSYDLPKKLFILTTSGCLLQYAETGSSERAPEKALQLGKDSAAFACDLIPGRHHVLEVLQSVAEIGGGGAGGSGSGSSTSTSTSSLLKKFGLRGAATRRQASNFLLVMADAEALSAWMSAVRKQIEALGGKRARPDSMTRRPKTGVAEAAGAGGGAPVIDLKKTPSQSHRYQVRRDPKRVSVITSPTRDHFAVEQPRSPDAPASPEKTRETVVQAASRGLLQLQLPTSPVELSAVSSPIELSADGGLEDIKEVATENVTELATESPTESNTASTPVTDAVAIAVPATETPVTDAVTAAPMASPTTGRPRNHSDSDSDTSSSDDSTSVDQRHLDKLRESTRMSHTSTVNTVATSRTNSLTSSPPAAEHLLSGVEDAHAAFRENGPAKIPYRSLSSYTLAKRRSVLPAAKEAPAPLLLQRQHRAVIDAPIDSPVLGHHTMHPEPSPKKRLSAFQSAPDLKSAAAESAEKADLPTSFPPLPPPSVRTDERPLSVVAELPSADLWASRPSPLARLSTIAATPSTADTTTALPPMPASRRLSSNLEALRSSRRDSSLHSFSLPLRINSTEPSANVIKSSTPRPMRSTQEDAGLVSPVAAVHTLTAKVDPATRTTIDLAHIPPRKSSATTTTNSPPRTAGSRRSSTARLSLFPSAVPSSPPAVVRSDPLRRSPSASALLTLAQPSPLQSHPVQPASSAAAVPTSLRRPTSMQIGTDRAPFLANVRSAAQPALVEPPQPILGVRAGMPVPIRSLKPSRSPSITSSTPGVVAAPPTLAANGFAPRRESLLYSQPRRESLLGATGRRESLLYSGPLALPSASHSSPALLSLMIAENEVTDVPTPVSARSADSVPAPLEPSSVSAPATALPTPNRSPSRASHVPAGIQRKSSRALPRASLPELDFGIPVVGLGPPAPPPSAPLPKLPGVAGASTNLPGPLSPPLVLPIVPASAPVGSFAAPVRSEGGESPATPMTPPTHLPMAGLGIQVGGS